MICTKDIDSDSQRLQVALLIDILISLCQLFVFRLTFGVGHLKYNL